MYSWIFSSFQKKNLIPKKKISSSVHTKKHWYISYLSIILVPENLTFSSRKTIFWTLLLSSHSLLSPLWTTKVGFVNFSAKAKKKVFKYFFLFKVKKKQDLHFWLDRLQREENTCHIHVSWNKFRFLISGFHFGLLFENCLNIFNLVEVVK